MMPNNGGPLFTRATPGINVAVLAFLADLLGLCISLRLAIYVRLHLTFLPPISQSGLALWLPAFSVVMPLIWGGTFLGMALYDHRYAERLSRQVGRLLAASAIATIFGAGLLYLTAEHLSRWFFALFVSFSLLCLMGWRLLAWLIWQPRQPVERRVLIMGAGSLGQRVGQMIQGHKWMGLELMGYLDDVQHQEYHVLGTLNEVRQVVNTHGIKDVVIALPSRAYNDINNLVLTLNDLPVQVRVVPDYFTLALYRSSAEEFGGLPMINLRDPMLNDGQRLIKRLFDLVVGCLLILSVLPVLLVTAVLTKLDSPGPVLFRQPRVGENGRLFEMYKFRSMITGAETLQQNVNRFTPEGKLLHKQADDPRVTRIGRFLRRTSLDELPQLFNVLKGEMSLVGPRPEMPWLVGEYEPWQHKRFAVPQGLTGWWQVHGRADKPMHMHTQDDLYYIQNYSLWMDIYILIKTPWVVVRGKGAY